MSLNEYRYFDPDPGVRKIAMELYSSVKDLPIICPHGHVDPRMFAENTSFPDPAELIIIPDHYIYRMLYSQGISLESLGISALDGSEIETDRKKIWQIFADNYYLYAGTPTGAWLSHIFSEIFSIEEKLNSDNAMQIYDQMMEMLQSPEFMPRTLFNQFNIEVITTTDGASDSLEYHKSILESGWEGKIIPCFRPDTVVNILGAEWKNEIDSLSRASGIEVNSYKTFLEAIANRREFFAEMGAVSTDQGVLLPFTHSLSDEHADEIFQKALAGKANVEDNRLFTANMLMEMARLSIDDGLVMQIHPGSFRNHNKYIFDRFGLDKGCDIPVETEYTYNLHELLNTYGNNYKLKLILFTLDESTYARELAPLAGHYPVLKLGPAWWFNDSIEGMTRYRQMVTESAGFHNTVGFNDDTRAFLSIPARHDLSRRVDSNFLAGLVAKHVIDKKEALQLAYELTNGLVKKGYGL